MQQNYGYTQAPALPPGWQMAYTPDGKQYFIDHNNKSTHWTLPASAYEAPYGYNARGSGGRGGVGYRGGARRGMGIDRTKQKTKLCLYWEKNGTCAFGERCAFAHGAEELQSPAKPQSGNPSPAPH